MSHPSRYAKDFSAAQRTALVLKGVLVIGATAIPADDTDVYFSATGYCLDDNGTHRIRAYREVVELAK